MKNLLLSAYPHVAKPICISFFVCEIEKDFSFQIVEHGTSNAKIMCLIPRVCINW